MKPVAIPAPVWPIRLNALGPRWILITASFSIIF